MARRALKGIQWAAMAEMIPESEKHNFVALKSQSDQFLQRVTSFSESPLKIDWALYKKNVPVPGMVDKFQKEYESLSIPYPVDKYTARIEEREKVVLAEIEKFKVESNKRIETFTAEAARLKALLPFDQMTMEDFAELYPDIAINIDKPTIWPHDPESQPDDRDVATPMPKPEH